MARRQKSTVLSRAIAVVVRTCRGCGCTDDDCRECIEATGTPCHWVEFDLCSRCAGDVRNVEAAERILFAIDADGSECLVREFISDAQIVARALLDYHARWSVPHV